MILLLCLLLPPIGILCAGRPFQAATNCVLLVLFLPAAWVHSILVAIMYYADKRTTRIERAIRETRR